MVHFGTPCTTFSRARRDDGGPPPLRNEQFLLGLGSLSELNAEKVRLGNLFLDITIDLVLCVVSAGGHWSIENPAGSMIWLMPQMLALLAKVHSDRYYLDMCAFSAKHKKPTVFVSSVALLADFVKVCPGCSTKHVHFTLQGRVRGPNGKWIWATKLAQAYPGPLCSAYAEALQPLRTAAGKEVSLPCAASSPVCPLLAAPDSTFALTVPAAERKRDLGAPCRFVEHR